MLKKLSQFIKSLFLREKSPIMKEFEEKAAVYNDSLKKKEVEIHLDTGKIVFPDDITPEERAELEEAFAQLNEQLQQFAPEELYASLEDFLAEGGNSGGLSFPPEYTKANDLENSLAKIAEEMEFCEENIEHWNDEEFISALIEWENKGYTFTGFDEIYEKAYKKIELSQLDKSNLRNWYKLVSQDLVYDV